MNNTNTRTNAADPRPFLRHMGLAQTWCQYNGQRGTERQVLRVMDRLSAADLERMLAERGVDCVFNRAGRAVAVCVPE